VMMSAKSKNKDAAYVAMEFLVQEKAATIMALKGKQPVALKKVYDNPAVKNDKYLPKFRAQIAKSRPMPSIPQMTSVWSPASTAIAAAVNGNKTPEEALNEAQRKVVDALSKAGYKK